MESAFIFLFLVPTGGQVLLRRLRGHGYKKVTERAGNARPAAAAVAVGVSVVY